MSLQTPTSASPPRVALRRAPLAPAAALIAGGIVAGRYLCGAPGVFGVIGLAAVVTAAVALRREHLRPLVVAAIGAAIFCLSAVSGALAYNYVPPNHIMTFSEDGAILATIRGRIITAPQIRQPVNAFWEPPKTSFLLDASSIRRNDGAWLDAQGLIRITVDEPVYDLPAGRAVELVGSLGRIRPPSNPGQCDWRRADRYRGILVKFTVPGCDGIVPRPQDDGGMVQQAFWRLRHLARRHVTASGERDDALLLDALVLGERAPALEDLNRAMVEAGTAHMLSISGQHMAIFLGFIYLVLRVLTFSPRRSAVIVLAALAAYLLLVEANAPLLRSAIMAAALCIAAISGRAISPANALAGAAVVLLLLDPLQLFRAEFQLSFGIVAGILVLYRPVKSLVFGRWLRRRGLMVFRGRGRLRRWLYFRAADWLIALACLSVSAYVSSVPLVAYHFGLFSPYAPMLSALLSPLMTLVLVPAYVSMALAWPMPNASAAIGELATTAAGWMRQASFALQHLPALSIDLYAVPAWLVGLFYLTVVLWLLRGHGRAVFAAACTATAGLIVATAITQRPAAPPPTGQLHVLDVAHGSMTLLHAPDGKTVLFDAGTLGSVNAYHQILRPFLRQKRLPSPEIVFISHANIDHYNALPDLAGRHPPRRAYVNEYFAGDPAGERRAAELIKALAGRKCRVIRLGRGQSADLGGGMSADVLWPPPPQEAAGLNVNDTSLVLRISGRGASVLLPGDVGEAGEAPLAALPPEQIQSDVLVLPHHGSLTPTLRAFIAAVGPKVVVQSNSFRQPPAELLAAIGHRPRYATFQEGWIGLTLSQPAPAVETMRARKP